MRFPDVVLLPPNYQTTHHSLHSPKGEEAEWQHAELALLPNLQSRSKARLLHPVPPIPELLEFFQLLNLHLVEPTFLAKEKYPLGEHTPP